MARTTRKCAFAQCPCLHATTDVELAEAVKDGKKYFHPDCYVMRKQLAEIRDYFKTYINSGLMGTQYGELSNIINDIVFKKKLEPDYVMFALQYMRFNRPGKLRYPAGLYYVINDNEIKMAWARRKLRAAQEQKEPEIEETPDEIFGNDDSEVFSYVQMRPRGFADILG